MTNNFINPVNEDAYENSVIELFEGMGYTHVYGPDIEDRDFYSPLYEDVLINALYKINPKLPESAIKEALYKLKNFENGSLVQKNKTFMSYLQNGVEVKFVYNGEERNAIVYLIDYSKADNNTFYAVNQYTYIENGNNRRPDIILFINV